MKKYCIIIAYYAGDISISDVKNLMERQNADPDYSTHFDSIHDFRDCNLKITPDDITPYINYLRNDLNMIANRKIAFLTNDPTKVVITTLFAERIESVGIRSEVFHTTGAVLRFLHKKGLEKPEFSKFLLEVKESKDFI